MGTAGIGHFLLRRAPGNRVTVDKEYISLGGEMKHGEGGGCAETAEAITARLRTIECKAGPIGNARWKVCTRFFLVNYLLKHR